MKNFSFRTSYWDASTKYGHKHFFRFATLCFLSFLLLLSVRQDSVKSKNVLLLNKGRASLTNFVTINLLRGFSWLFLGIKVRAFTRDTKYAN